MFYVGFCPVCDQGALGLRVCGNQAHMVALCDECDAVWLTTDLSRPPVFPTQPDLPCPHCAGTLTEAAAHWASREEIQQAGWQDAVLGWGPVVGEDVRDANGPCGDH